MNRVPRFSPSLAIQALVGEEVTGGAVIMCHNAIEIGQHLFGNGRQECGQMLVCKSYERTDGKRVKYKI